MRIIFMGSPEFAVPSLKILYENSYNIVAVITSTDKMGGRGKKNKIEPAIKKYAASKDLLILQPKNLKSPKFIRRLRKLQADLQIVVAFRMLPEVVWNMPKLGTYNLHGSLLPKYRGAAPINWAIINGETETGVTSFRLKHKIDTGDVLFTEKIPIQLRDTASELHDRMKIVAASVILKTVRAIKNENLIFSTQNENEVSLAPKIYRETCEINFDQSSLDVYNFIRGLSLYPGAWTIFKNKSLKILKCDYEIIKHKKEAGEIVFENNQLKIATDDGYILPHKVQLEGKRKMNMQEFSRGIR